MPTLSKEIIMARRPTDRQSKVYAIFYGLSIIIIYVVLGTIVTGIFGPDVLNAAATNVYINIFFFLILLIFGISFLGAFEIVVPSSWINKADQQSEKGGIIGIFFMALDARQRSKRVSP